jgi:hypothetical protein
MNFIYLLKKSNSLINVKSEESFSFIFHKRIEQLDHLKNKVKNIGVLSRVGVFFYNIIIRISLRKSSSKNIDYVFYSGTKNQYDSLFGSFSALIKHSSVLSVLDGRWLEVSNKNEQYIRLTPIVVIVSLLLFVYRSPGLYKRLKGEGLSDSINLYFDRFCSVYYYVPYFLVLLTKIQPKFVLMSNDHSPANRSLLFVANSLGIKTVYMQHASVSNLFPNLEFDYSFLDGVNAYEIYKEIDLIERTENMTIFSEKYIFLTGQKKKVAKNNVKYEEFVQVCGVGFSHLDSNDFIIKVIDSLRGVFAQCYLRFHPSHSTESITLIKKHFSNNNSILFSAGTNELLKDFLEPVDVFFGSGTSLHLEVALSGVRCIYIENAHIKNKDYYSYERTGLVTPIKIADITRNYFSDFGLEQNENEKRAVKKYSATYNTEWFGSEGELVISILKDIEDSIALNVPLSIEYMHKDSNSNMWSV